MAIASTKDASWPTLTPIAENGSDAKHEFSSSNSSNLDSHSIPLGSSDVNNDSTVAPLDSLVILNDRNRNGSRQLPARTDPLAPFLDVNGDRAVTPLDALVIINEHNRGDRIDTRGFVTVPLKTLPGNAKQFIRAKSHRAV